MSSAISFLLSDWRFHGGLAFMGLGTTKVLPTSQHSRQLLHSHIETLTGLLCCPLVEVFLGHLQPDSCCQDAGGAGSRFMGQTGGVGDRQDHLSYFLPLLFFSCLGLFIFNWVQVPLWDVELHKQADSSIDYGQQGGLVRYFC